MTSTLTDERKLELSRLQTGALAVGAAALAICIIAAFFDPAQFFRAYLVAYLFCLGIAHGCLVVLMIYHLTGGAWGYLIRRTLEAGTRTLPLLAILFLPIGFGVAELYDWAQPAQVAASRSLQRREVYLNVPFFWVRAVAYFVLWIAIAFNLGLWSRRQDETGDPVYAERLSRLSGPGLVVYGITITFASIDWIMSLQPAFRSTIFGPLLASGEVLTGFSVTLIVLAWLALRTPLGEVVSVEALNDLGNLLLTFLVIWAYLNFFQYMLIWIANLRYDVIWYLPRSRGGWQVVAWFLIFFHLVVPFFLLLSREIKRNPRALAALGGLILFMHLAYLHYQVMPAFPEATLTDHWMDFVAPLGLGGLWLAFFLWNLKRAPVLAPHDANRETALRYEQHDVMMAEREREVQRG